jgi:hypothetical protein
MPACLTEEEKRLEQHYRRLRTRNPFCLTCGFSRHPAGLQYSHIIPNAMHDDGGAQCHNCHSEFSDAERNLPYSTQTMNPQMEIIGRYLMNLAEWLRRIAETIAAFGAWLFDQAHHVLPYEAAP